MKNSAWNRLIRIGVAAGCGATLGMALLVPSPSNALFATPTTAPGKQVFVDSGCAQCHGIRGLGTGKGPSLHDVRKRMSNEQVYRQIQEGGKSMPPFGAALTSQQTKELVDFLLSKSAWKEPFPPPTPPPAN